MFSLSGYPPPPPPPVVTLEEKQHRTDIALAEILAFACKYALCIMVKSVSVLQGSRQLYVLTSLSLSQHAPMQPMIEPVNVANIPRTENAVTALMMAIIAFISSQSSTEINYTSS